MSDEGGLAYAEGIEDRDIVAGPGLDVIAVFRLAGGQEASAGNPEDMKIRFSRNSHDWPQGVVRSGMTEELVSMQVQREPLEEPSNVEDPVAAPCKHFHPVVEALYNAAGLPTLEVIRDLIYPPIDSCQRMTSSAWKR